MDKRFHKNERVFIKNQKNRPENQVESQNKIIKIKKIKNFLLKKNCIK